MMRGWPVATVPEIRCLTPCGPGSLIAALCPEAFSYGLYTGVVRVDVLDHDGRRRAHKGVGSASREPQGSFSSCFDSDFLFNIVTDNVYYGYCECVICLFLWHCVPTLHCTIAQDKDEFSSPPSSLSSVLLRTAARAAEVAIPRP